jgi:hypothetical protein
VAAPKVRNTYQRLLDKIDQGNNRTDGTTQ